MLGGPQYTGHKHVALKWRRRQGDGFCIGLSRVTFHEGTLQSLWLASAPITAPKNRVCANLPNFVSVAERFSLGEYVPSSNVRQ